MRLLILFYTLVSLLEICYSVSAKAITLPRAANSNRSIAAARSSTTKSATTKSTTATHTSTKSSSGTSKSGTTRSSTTRSSTTRSSTTRSSTTRSSTTRSSTTRSSTTRSSATKSSTIRSSTTKSSTTGSITTKSSTSKGSTSKSSTFDISTTIRRSTATSYNVLSTSTATRTSTSKSTLSTSTFTTGTTLLRGTTTKASSSSTTIKTVSTTSSTAKIFSTTPLTTTVTPYTATSASAKSATVTNASTSTSMAADASTDSYSAGANPATTTATTVDNSPTNGGCTRSVESSASDVATDVPTSSGDTTFPDTKDILSTSTMPTDMDATTSTGTMMETSTTADNACIIAPTTTSTTTTAAAANTIWLAGDSTMASALPPAPAAQIGWGEFLRYSFSSSEFAVVNKAIPGRSARSFTRQGHFAEITDAVKPGDWVIIEFGHNDGVTVFSPANDTGSPPCPGVGNETCTSMMNGVNETVYTFPAYLRMAAESYLAKGAKVVIGSSTPLNPWYTGRYSWTYIQPWFYYSWLTAVQLGGPAKGVYFVPHGYYGALAARNLGNDFVNANYLTRIHTQAGMANVFAQAFAFGLKCGTSPLASSMVNATGTMPAYLGACKTWNSTMPI